MKLTKSLSRSQKIALLSQLVEGNNAPLVNYKAAQDKPFAYLLDATQTFAQDRNLLDAQPDDLITGIVLTSSYADGRPNKVERKPDMIRRDFDAWYSGLRENGFAVVGMLRTCYVEADLLY